MKDATLTDFEKTVLECLLDGDDAILATLRQQLNACAHFEREFTGSGFYLKFEIPEDVQRVKPTDFHFGDVSATSDGLEHGAGFVLFVRNGVLDMLEGYSFEEPWPASGTSWNVGYVGDAERDLETVRKAWS